MVEPLDAQNLLSRTPLVEKAAASQRDQAAQLNLPASQMEREAQHQAGSVELHPRTQRAGDRHPNRPGQGRKQGGHPAQHPEVTQVAEAAETPAHELDITV